MSTLASPILLCLLFLAGATPSLAQTAPQAAAESAAEAPELKATYLANEGFLLEAAGRKVLVDALVGRNPLYIIMSPATRRRLETAQGPFAGVDLVLATHYHADHFDAAAVARHLAANPKAVFVSTPQAVAALRQLPGFAAFQDRVRTSLPAEGRRETFPDLGLEVLNLHHGRDRKPPVENLAFVIQLGPFKVLHVGDTEASAKEFAAYGLAKDGIDLALLPDWLLLYERWQGVVEAVAPRRLAAMHLQTDSPADHPEKIRRFQPGVWVAQRQGATLVVQGRDDAPSGKSAKPSPRP
jgi:L-ascorbate metabolism protein UlaG (beta-lactamase superfamily)